MEKQFIASETKSALYWLEKAIDYLKAGNSAVFALLTAAHHASSLDVYKTQAGERDVEIDFASVFAHALEKAREDKGNDEK